MIRTILFLALYSVCSGIALSQTIPNQAVIDQSQQLNDVYRQLGQLDGRLKSTEDEASKAREEAKDAFLEAQESEKYLYVIAALFAIFFVVAITATIAYTRKSFSKQAKDLSDSLSIKAEQRLTNESKELFRKFAADLSKESENAVRKIEDKYFQYMQITSLRYSKQYDDALRFVSWSGDFKPYIDFPQAVQRSLVACLCNSSKAKQSKEHLKAWQWSRDLVEKDRNADNLISMIKTGNTLKHWDEVIELYEKIVDTLSVSDKDRCEPYLFVSYRRSCNPERREHNARRVKRIAEKNQSTKDIKFKTTLAAFYRDEGRFEEAEMVMNPDIRQFTGSSHLIEGWDKLFNTYLANAIDQGKPESAIAQVRTMLAQPLTPDHIFNCARLAWRLSEEDKNKDNILRLIKRRFEDGLMPEKDDGTVKTVAILNEIEGKASEAEEALKDSIEELSRESGSWSNYQHYYYKCMLAELYQSRTERAEWDKSIDLLEPLVSNDNIGEATYLLSKAYALTAEHSLMKRYLDNAGSIKRKWIMKAKADVGFSGLKAVDELLSKYVTTG